MENSMISKNRDDLNTGNDAEGDLGDRFNSLAHDAGVAALDSSKTTLHDLRAKTEQVTSDVTALYQDGAEILRKQVAGKPITALAVAMAVGALTAGLFLRK